MTPKATAKGPFCPICEDYLSEDNVKLESGEVVCLSHLSTDELAAMVKRLISRIESMKLKE